MMIDESFSTWLLYAVSSSVFVSHLKLVRAIIVFRSQFGSPNLGRPVPLLSLSFTPIHTFPMYQTSLVTPSLPVRASPVAFSRLFFYLLTFRKSCSSPTPTTTRTHILTHAPCLHPGPTYAPLSLPTSSLFNFFLSLALRRQPTVNRLLKIASRYQRQ